MLIIYSHFSYSCLNFHTSGILECSRGILFFAFFHSFYFSLLLFPSWTRFLRKPRDFVLSFGYKWSEQIVCGYNESQHERGFIFEHEKVATKSRQRASTAQAKSFCSTRFTSDIKRASSSIISAEISWKFWNFCHDIKLLLYFLRFLSGFVRQSCQSFLRQTFSILSTLWEMIKNSFDITTSLPHFPFHEKFNKNPRLSLYHSLRIISRHSPDINECTVWIFCALAGLFRFCVFRLPLARKFIVIINIIWNFDNIFSLRFDSAGRSFLKSFCLDSRMSELRLINDRN